MKINIMFAINVVMNSSISNTDKRRTNITIDDFF